MPRAADYDVIMQNDIEPFGGFDDRLRYAQIRRAGAGIPRRMVMGQDEPAGAEIKRTPDDFPRKDIRPIDRTADGNVIAQQPVLRIQVERTDLLRRLMREVREQIVDNRTAARQDRGRPEVGLQ